MYSPQVTRSTLQENKALKASQAKVSVETAKEISQDKTVRNKAEKERRLREKNQNNYKKFIDERKTVAIKHSKEKEKLQKTHDQQLHDLSKDIQNSIEMYKNAEIEYELTPKSECFV
ncbi:unnamed protein product [Allacma fusca]|uniref:Uncharacterized protein n=1 Tax=Allacma fusca TaxID=39272 RepID=A0A8J2PTF9_9HEXA|nr:unnamed protein product [Allacma fusca]